MDRLRLLLVEDSDRDAEQILHELERSGFDVSLRRVQTVQTLTAALTEPFDLVLCEEAIPMLDAHSVLEQVRKSSADVPFIVVSASVGGEAAAEIAQGGATGELSMCQIARLGLAVTRELAAVRARAEQRRVRLAREQAEATEMDRMATIGVLAAGVGHEISNPLACILANLEFVTDELEVLIGELPSEAAVRLASRIIELSAALADTHQAAERVRTVVQDLRKFSHDDDGAMTNVDVRDVLDSALRMTGLMLRQRATIVKDYADVPRVVANESRLGQVCLSLMVNAAQALREGAPAESRIEIAVRLEGALVTVTVAASGVAPESPPPFDPAPTTSSRAPVLGLRICRDIVAQHGGDITATEEPAGVRFVMRLPPVAAGPQDPSRPSPAPFV